VKAEPSSWEMAEHLNLSVDTVVLANRISILALFGLSHYLQWAGFDIQHTTDFKELSTKLAFARNTLAKIGFRLILGGRILANDHFQ